MYTGNRQSNRLSSHYHNERVWSDRSSSVLRRTGFKLYCRSRISALTSVFLRPLKGTTVISVCEFPMSTRLKNCGFFTPLSRGKCSSFMMSFKPQAIESNPADRVIYPHGFARSFFLISSPGKYLGGGPRNRVTLRAVSRLQSRDLPHPGLTSLRPHTNGIERPLTF